MSSKKEIGNIQKNVYNKVDINPKGVGPNELRGDQMELATLSWEGDSREVLRSFPKAAREDIGYALRRLQLGVTPKNSRPMKSIGAGVFEIKASDNRAWYRAIYLSKVGNTFYVLHIFEKKTGKTEKKDLETASIRLARVRQRLLKESQDGKRKDQKNSASKR